MNSLLGLIITLLVIAFWTWIYGSHLVTEYGATWKKIRTDWVTMVMLISMANVTQQSIFMILDFAQKHFV